MPDDHPSLVLDRLTSELARLDRLMETRGYVTGRCDRCYRAQIPYTPPRPAVLTCDGCRSDDAPR